MRVPSSSRNPAPTTPGYRTTSNCRREAAKQIANQRRSAARPIRAMFSTYRRSVLNTATP